MLLVNKDQTHPHAVSIVFQDASSQDSFFVGPVYLTTFDSRRYQWHPDVKGGWADPDDPPLRTSIVATTNTVFELPEASLHVVRGRLLRQ